MTRVWISIGSNIDRERHIRAALRELGPLFGELVVSPVYETEAVGFEGDAFYNLVVGVETERRPGELHRLMREIEARNGRRRSGSKFSSRTLDLDLLTYGDAVTEEGGKPLPRDEILKYAFVLAPLADVAPGERHPETGQTYREMWADYAEPDREGLHRLEGGAWLRDPGPGPA
jgi:2-amino-4-hydroxy-6-hydroxymethyldihydropteridine diphosphokinase